MVLSWFGLIWSISARVASPSHTERTSSSQQPQSASGAGVDGSHPPSRRRNYPSPGVMGQDNKRLNQSFSSMSQERLPALIPADWSGASTASRIVQGYFCELFWCIFSLLLFSAIFPCAENRCVVSLGETCPGMADSSHAQTWGKQHLSQITVKLRMSCLLCHLCAEFSEYLAMLLPRHCFVTHQHPRGSKFSLASISSPLLSFSLGALPRASRNAALQASGEAGRQHGKPLEKHNLMQMSKARSAFLPGLVV